MEDQRPEIEEVVVTGPARADRMWGMYGELAPSQTWLCWFGAGDTGGGLRIVDGKLCFEGDADAAALTFFEMIRESIQPLVDHYLTSRGQYGPDR